MTEGAALRVFWKELRRQFRFDGFAVWYVVGALFYAADAGTGLGWPFLHTVFWVLAAPAVWYLGVRVGRRNNEQGTS